MKLKLTLIAVIIILGSFLYYTHTQLKKQKSENRRLEYNLEHSDFLVDSLTSKNGETFYKYSALVLTKNELQKINDSIIKENESLGIKIKNLESTSKIETQYIVRVDTLETTKINDNVFMATYKDSDVGITERITLTGTTLENCIPVVDSLHVNLTDKLLISYEPIYKRRWIFWKRMTGIKTYIKSDNKYFRLNKVETYIIQKRCGKNKNNF